MWPLLLCSILGVAFIVERAIAYSRIKGDTAEIFSTIREWTALCDPPSGYPLGSSAYCMSTPAGPDPEAGALARLVIVAPAAFRHENLHIIPAARYFRPFTGSKMYTDWRQNKC